MYLKSACLLGVVILISVIAWQYSSSTGLESTSVESGGIASVNSGSGGSGKAVSAVGKPGKVESILESSSSAVDGLRNGGSRVGKASPPEMHGKSVPGGLAFDENEVIGGLSKEILAGQSPAAQTSLILPEPFDKESYLADPESYLKQVRPGRVFQSAQPGPGVKRIAARSKALHRLLQGESTLLEVMVDPGMPVTFYTQQSLGEFDNRLSTISLKADEGGVARANFKAAKAAGMVNIIAASPVHSEQVEFAVRVSVPDVVKN